MNSRESSQNVISFRGSVLIAQGVLATILVVFGVMLFPNYPVWIVASVLLLFSLPALIGVVFLTVSGNREVEKKPLRRVAPVAVASGLFMAPFPLVAMVRWSDFFSNFPYLRLEFGGGFNSDSVFHLSIIQSILRTGFPSTSQHHDPLIGYHVLSHYLDAAVITVFALDPFESYALFFFAKASAFMVFLLFLFAALRSKFPGWPQMVLVVPFTFAVTGDWHVMSSHGQWAPVLILILATPYLVDTISRERLRPQTSLLMTVLVIVLSLGKTSIGFGVALLIGLAWLIRFPRSMLVYATGALWTSWFALLAYLWNRPPDVRWENAFILSTPEFLTIFLLAALALVLSYAWRQRNYLILSAAAFMSGAVVLALSVAFFPGAYDVFYFAHGLLITLTLVFFSFVFQGHAELGSEELRAERRRQSLATLAAASIAWTALSPVIEASPLSPLGSTGESAAGYLRAVPEITQRSRFSDIAAGDSSLNVDSRVESDTYWAMLREGVQSQASGKDYALRDIELFIPKKEMEFIERRFHLERKWDTGLLVAAVTGASLIKSVPAGTTHESFGFGYAGSDSYYSADAYRTDIEEGLQIEICSAETPVLVLVDADAQSWEWWCG